MAAPGWIGGLVVILMETLVGLLSGALVLLFLTIGKRVFGKKDEAK